MIRENLLDSIYAISTSEDALAVLVAKLASAFDCVSAALVYVNPIRPASDVALGYGTFSGAALVRYESYAALDPAPAAFAALPIGTAAATDRFFSPEDRAVSRFLIEYYHPLGLCEALGAPIAKAEGQLGILGVHRGNDRPPFTDAEIATFGEIARHVARAFTMRGRFFAMARAAETLGDMLNTMAAGVMAVDGVGRLVEANAAARVILGREDGLMLTRSGRVRAADKIADAALREAFAGNVAETPGIVVVPRVGRARAYAVKVSPCIEGGVSPRLVQIADDRAPAGDIEQTLAEALRLSPASARLTAALLRGEDLRTYAKRAGISENTAKFHLKGAFRATSTRRQGELIRLAVGMLRDLSV